VLGGIGLCLMVVGYPSSKPLSPRTSYVRPRRDGTDLLLKPVATMPSDTDGNGHSQATPSPSRSSFRE